MTLPSIKRILHFATGGCDMGPKTRLKCIAKECEGVLAAPNVVEGPIAPQQALRAFLTIWPSVVSIRRRSDDSVVIYRGGNTYPSSEIIYIPNNRIDWSGQPNRIYIDNADSPSTEPKEAE